MGFLANVDVAADLNNQYKGADSSNLYNRADEIFAGRFNAGVELAQQRGGDGKLRMSVPGPIADDDMSVEGLFAKFFASLTDPTGVMPPALSGSASQGMSARTELNEDDEAELQRIVGQGKFDRRDQFQYLCQGSQQQSSTFFHCFVRL